MILDLHNHSIKSDDARAKVDAFMQEETSKMMGGVQLPPGFKMPF